MKSAAGLASYSLEDAENNVPPGARNVLIPTNALPDSSRIVARHMRKLVTPDLFLEKPIYNPHLVENVPLPWDAPISLDEYNLWREEHGGRAVVPSLDTAAAKKKKPKKDKDALASGRKTKRSKKDSQASPHPPPVPETVAPPPPPPGDAPLPPAPPPPPI